MAKDFRNQLDQVLYGGTFSYDIQELIDLRKSIKEFLS